MHNLARWPHCSDTLVDEAKLRVRCGAAGIAVERMQMRRAAGVASKEGLPTTVCRGEIVHAITNCD